MDKNPNESNIQELVDIFADLVKKSLENKHK